MKIDDVTEDIHVRSNGSWAAVFAARELEEGERVLDVSGREGAEPDRYSIQVGHGTHVYPNGAAWKYLNHSCAPNLRYSSADRAFHTLRVIREGEELSFNYLTTEWDMAEGFECRCGAPSCVGHVAGFSKLGPEKQRELLPDAAPHIRQLFEADGRAPRRA